MFTRNLAAFVVVSSLSLADSGSQYMNLVL
jgi:hypothetical protein